MSEAKNGRVSGERQTLVEEGTEFKGTLSSSCPIVIKGRLEGEVAGPSLHVSASGSVSGTVKVGEINSEGELAGHYEADVVRLAGRVKDRTVIKAKSLEIKLAPAKGRLEVMFGECELEIGDQPTREQAVESGARPVVPLAAPATTEKNATATGTAASPWGGGNDAIPHAVEGKASKDGSRGEPSGVVSGS
jgi:cytoskeletal protein CcmA (bactofilin family)